jgi:hypothetical protein
MSEREARAFTAGWMPADVVNGADRREARGAQ